MNDEEKKPVIPLLISFSLLLGFIGGATMLASSTAWINGTGVIYPNNSWSDNVNVTGILYENNSRVCTVSNGLCTSAGGEPLWDGNYSSVYTKSNPLSFYNQSTIIGPWIIQTGPYLDFNGTKLNADFPRFSYVDSLGNYSKNTLGFYNSSNPPPSSGRTIVTNVTTDFFRITGTTLANISNQTWNLNANTNYTFECIVLFSSNTTTNGISFALEDWGGTWLWMNFEAMIREATAVQALIASTNVTATKITTTGVTAVNTVYPAQLSGIIYNGASNIKVTPQYSAELTGQNVTIHRGTRCEVTTI